MILSLTIVYVIVASFLIWILMFGDPEGDTFRDRCNRLISVNLANIINRSLAIVFGPKGPEWASRIWVYLFHSNNQLVKYFYFVFVNLSYIGFVVSGYHLLPNRYASAFHKYTGFLSFLLCMFTFYKAAYTNPGKISTENFVQEIARYPFDEWIFAEKKICETCAFMKPARSKHCRFCNVCISRYDHHCIWLGQCVGRNNYKWFLAFLVSHIWLCVYGVLLGATILAEEVSANSLFEAYFIEASSGQRVKGSYSVIGKYLLSKHFNISTLILLGLIMGLVLSGFLLYHLNLVRTGRTTNEASKWEVVNSVLKNEKFNDIKPVNIYDKGFAVNLREVLVTSTCNREMNNQRNRSNARKRE